MSRKKGWVKIMEASIAITIIMGFMVLVYSRVIEPPPRSEGILTWEMSILDELKNDPYLRSQIITDPAACTSAQGPVYTFLSQRVPSIFPGFGFACKVCPTSDVCGPANYRAEMYSEERIISATLTSFSPKKIKLFVWPLEEGETITPPSCTLTTQTCTFLRCDGTTEIQTCTDGCTTTTKQVLNSNNCQVQDNPPGAPGIVTLNCIGSSTLNKAGATISCSWTGPDDADLLETVTVLTLSTTEIERITIPLNEPKSYSKSGLTTTGTYTIKILTKDKVGNINEQAGLKTCSVGGSSTSGYLAGC